jgi:ribosomal protein S18 acetylase RimI-like enzyme
LTYDFGVTAAVASRGIVLRPLKRYEIQPLAAMIPETSEAHLANRWREQAFGYRELLAAVKDGEVVGTVSVAVSERPAASLHLFAFEVVLVRRNQGIGAAILREVLDDARRRGLRRVYLEVRVDNPARRLYHRLGFRRVGDAFINSWWRYLEDGSQERVEELSYRMVKRV